MPRRLIRNSKLRNRQLNELVRYLALEVPASRAAKVMGINRHSGRARHPNHPPLPDEGVRTAQPARRRVEFMLPAPAVPSAATLE